MKFKHLIAALTLILAIPSFANNRIKTVEASIENTSSTTLVQKEIIHNNEMHFQGPGMVIAPGVFHDDFSATSDESKTTKVQILFDVMRNGQKIDTLEMFWQTNMGSDGYEFHICGASNLKTIFTYCDLPDIDPNHPETLQLDFHVQDH